MLQGRILCSLCVQSILKQPGALSTLYIKLKELDFHFDHRDHCGRNILLDLVDCPEFRKNLDLLKLLFTAVADKNEFWVHCHSKDNFGLSIADYIEGLMHKFRCARDIYRAAWYGGLYENRCANSVATLGSPYATNAPAGSHLTWQVQEPDFYYSHVKTFSPDDGSLATFHEPTDLARRFD